MTSAAGDSNHLPTAMSTGSSPQAPVSEYRTKDPSHVTPANITFSIYQEARLRSKLICQRARLVSPWSGEVVAAQFTTSLFACCCEMQHSHYGHADTVKAYTILKKTLPLPLAGNRRAWLFYVLDNTDQKEVELRITDINNEGYFEDIMLHITAQALFDMIMAAEQANYFIQKRWQDKDWRILRESSQQIANQVTHIKLSSETGLQHLGGIFNLRIFKHQMIPEAELHEETLISRSRNQANKSMIREALLSRKTPESVEVYIECKRSQENTILQARVLVDHRSHTLFDHGYPEVKVQCSTIVSRDQSGRQSYVTGNVDISFSRSTDAASFHKQIKRMRILEQLQPNTEIAELAKGRDGEEHFMTTKSAQQVGTQSLNPKTLPQTEPVMAKDVPKQLPSPPNSTIKPASLPNMHTLNLYERSSPTVMHTPPEEKSNVPLGLETISINRKNPWWKRFHEHTTTFVRNEREQNRKRLNGAEAPKRVKVAILDSGFDPKSTLFQEAKSQLSSVPRITFKDYTGESLSRRPVDKLGHGTRVLALLLEMTQNIDIWMARVYETDIGDQNTANRIAQALRDAREDQVDIISISFGFNETVHSIENELKEAMNKNILVFAAASNDRQLDADGYPITFPARMEGVFCINSHTADTNSKWSHFNPNAMDRRDNFSTVGENHFVGTARRTLEGTSYAVPIAAGIAALVLELERIYRSEHKTLGLADREQEWARNHMTMKGVFRSMCYPEFRFGRENAILPWRDIRQRNESQPSIWDIIKMAKDRTHD